MRRLLLDARVLTTAGAALLVVGGLLIVVSRVSSAAAASSAAVTGPSITVSPHTGLTAAEHLVVRGKDLTHSANGALLECNTAPGQPATSALIHGVTHAVPVGCTDPVATTTSALGRFLDHRLTAQMGTLGGWETGTDSTGGAADVDSGLYPCPPTPDQLTLGVTCVIEFLDNKGQIALRTITFKTPHGKPTTTTTATTTTMPPTTTSPTTTVPCPTTTVPTTPCGATLTMDPDSGIDSGTVVTLNGTGFTENTLGTFVECNTDPSQPTVLLDGNPLPVSCTNPFGSPGPGIVQTSATGTVGPVTFTVGVGTTGPPCGPSSCTGSDSSGGDPSTDAAAYPCPPTPTQVSAGDTCEIRFGDAADDTANVTIGFSPSIS